MPRAPDVAPRAPLPCSSHACSWDAGLVACQAHLESSIGQALARIVELPARIEHVEQTRAAAGVHARYSQQARVGAREPVTRDRELQGGGAPPSQQIEPGAARACERGISS